MTTLFDGTYSDEDRPRVPTLSQYLKDTIKSKLPKKHLIRIIWLPNKFPSYGLETEHFKTSVAKDSLLGLALEVFCDTCDDYNNALFVAILEVEPGKRSLSFEPGKESGQWEAIKPLNPLGLRFVFARKHTKNAS